MFIPPRGEAGATGARIGMPETAPRGVIMVAPFDVARNPACAYCSGSPASTSLVPKMLASFERYAGAVVGRALRGEFHPSYWFILAGRAASAQSLLSREEAALRPVTEAVQVECEGERRVVRIRKCSPSPHKRYDDQFARDLLPTLSSLSLHETRAW